MNIAPVQQHRMSPGPAGVAISNCYYEGSDALKPGYLLCANSDYGTAEAVQADRWHRAEKPATGKLHNFMGVVASGKSVYPAGPNGQSIYLPGSVCQVFTDQNCTIDQTLLTVKPGSYIAGGLGQGMVIAMALQTVDRSTVNGLVLAKLMGIAPAYDRQKWTVPSSTVRNISPAIWQTCPWEEIKANPGLGVTFESDFLDFTQAANIAAVASIQQNGVVAFTGATAGSTVTQETDEPYGVACLSCTTDNETVCLTGPGKNVAGHFVFETGKKLWMEARVKLPVLTDDLQGVFVGLGEEGLCVTVGVIGADDAMTDKDYVGFHHLAADGDTFDTVFNTSGGGTSPVTIKADAVTIVADTYVNLGIYCDGTTVYFYKDGVVLADSVALTATDFPDGEEMAWYMALTNKGGGDAVANIDWVRIAQLR